MRIIAPDPADGGRINALHLKAFDPGEREVVAALARALLEEESDPRVLHLVAQSDGGLVGHVAFSPVRRQACQRCIGFILAPLAVDPAWQKRGIGSQLVNSGLRAIGLRGGGIVLVYGDPAYYGRFGFCRGLAENFLPPCPLAHPSGWLALGLGAVDWPAAPVPIEVVGALRLPELW
jgi:putative acetyltransferase